jgi:hypothetical protein
MEASDASDDRARECFRKGRASLARARANFAKRFPALRFPRRAGAGQPPRASASCIQICIQGAIFCSKLKRDTLSGNLQPLQEVIRAAQVGIEGADDRVPTTWLIARTSFTPHSRKNFRRAMSIAVTPVRRNQQAGRGGRRGSEETGRCA